MIAFGFIVVGICIILNAVIVAGEIALLRKYIERIQGWQPHEDDMPRQQRRVQ